MTARIISLATALPPHRISQAVAEQIALRIAVGSPQELANVSRFYSHAGVRSRHSVILNSDHDPYPDFYPAPLVGDERGPTTAQRMERFEAESPALAAAAARRALEQSGLAPSEITHLVSVSCTGFHSPGFDIALVPELGLRPTVARTHVGFMGCHAALNGLRTVRAFTDADPASRVLMVAVELCSLHYQYGIQADRIIANALFADGAAALVGVGANHVADTPSPDPSWQLLANGSMIVPGTTDAMRWRIRDFGFEMSLSPQVPELILTHLRGWLDRWLQEQGLRVRDVAHWAIHPGGPRILAACGRACDLSPQQLQPSLDVLAEFGNMSSPTVLFILERLARQRATGPCVTLAFGPGLTIEAALLERDAG